MNDDQKNDKQERKARRFNLDIPVELYARFQASVLRQNSASLAEAIRAAMRAVL